MCGALPPQLNRGGQREPLFLNPLGPAVTTGRPAVSSRVQYLATALKTYRSIAEWRTVMTGEHKELVALHRELDALHKEVDNIHKKFHAEVDKLHAVVVTLHKEVHRKKN